MQTFWTDDKVNTALKLRKNGFSTSQIATQIGAPSRKAVSAKFLRLDGKTTIVDEAIPDAVQVEAELPEPEIVSVPKPFENKLRNIGIDFFQAGPSHCKYPLWDNTMKIGNVCGRRAHKGSWCQGHTSLVFIPSRGRY